MSLPSRLLMTYRPRARAFSLARSLAFSLARSLRAAAPRAARLGSALLTAPLIAQPARVPNELGRIPILEWHLVAEADGAYRVSRTRFAAELAELHARGYVPIALADLLAGRIDLPAGKSPVLLTFDDSSPSQFRYVERGGRLAVDSTSALGILEAFLARHPDWPPRAVFCLLPAADAGHAFFGDKGIEGQQTAWRHDKLRHLVRRGYELCNHTLWHARLDRMGPAQVREQLARGVLAIDSAVPGYPVRGLALPYGLWPRERALAVAGAWTPPARRGGAPPAPVRYRHEAVFLVAGGPARSPHDPAFQPLALPRVPLQGGTSLTRTLDALDRPGPGGRYVSDGNPATVARPPAGGGQNR
jgi:peptidoglycan/xylan/chitin deacetylase (PgdA/CDA1 family)